VAELALSAKEKKLNLEYHDDGKGPYPIYADTSKLEHVISNIVDNAIKYTPKGSVTVRVEKDIARNIGRVKVIDTGAGIPAEALPKLFDKFVRARNANEINVTGTGLGLYVAREMITKHNGKIWAESKGENRGSIFVVEIPLSDPRINSAQT
ncbi:histidine kinase, partial [Candidatus Kaiserbacteria bacterium CG10_big_fil_rev_8_21_14_0_10_43_70]